MRIGNELKYAYTPHFGLNSSKKEIILQYMLSKSTCNISIRGTQHAESSVKFLHSTSSCFFVFFQVPDNVQMNLAKISRKMKATLALQRNSASTTSNISYSQSPAI